MRSWNDNDNKCDPVDAEQLARFARVDPKLLSPIAHRDRATRADLGMLRSRSALVAARTQLVNHVRGCLKSFGARLGMCSTATFPRRAAWKIPRDLRRCLVPVLRTIAGLTQQILAFERRIEQVAGSRYPETQRLRQVDGVGAMTSLTFVLTLEDPRRFRTSRRVGAHLGLRPGRNQSGQGTPPGGRPSHPIYRPDRGLVTWLGLRTSRLGCTIPRSLRSASASPAATQCNTIPFPCRPVRSWPHSQSVRSAPPPARNARNGRPESASPASRLRFHS
jgi:hypothetical protein